MRRRLILLAFVALVVGCRINPGEDSLAGQYRLVRFQGQTVPATVPALIGDIPVSVSEGSLRMTAAGYYELTYQWRTSITGSYFEMGNWYADERGVIFAPRTAPGGSNLAPVERGVIRVIVHGYQLDFERR